MTLILIKMVSNKSTFISLILHIDDALGALYTNLQTLACWVKKCGRDRNKLIIGVSGGQLNWLLE